MVWLYIFLVMVLLLALILFTPINFTLEYKKHLKIKIRFFGIPIPVFSGNKKKQHRKSRKKTTEKHSSKKDIILSIKKIGILLKSSREAISQIFKKIKIRSLKIILRVGANDAAETAIRYGQANAIIYPALSIINNLSKPEKAMVNIVPNFPSEKTDIDFKVDIKSSVFNLLALAVILFKKYKELI